jgi:hypothetical protein
MGAVDTYLLAAICLYSTGHWVGGSVCLFISLIDWKSK